MYQLSNFLAYAFSMQHPPFMANYPNQPRRLDFYPKLVPLKLKKKCPRSNKTTYPLPAHFLSSPVYRHRLTRVIGFLNIVMCKCVHQTIVCPYIDLTHPFFELLYLALPRITMHGRPFLSSLGLEYCF